MTKPTCTASATKQRIPIKPAHLNATNKSSFSEPLIHDKGLRRRQREGVRKQVCGRKPMVFEDNPSKRQKPTRVRIVESRSGYPGTDNENAKRNTTRHPSGLECRRQAPPAQLHWRRQQRRVRCLTVRRNPRQPSGCLHSHLNRSRWLRRNGRYRDPADPRHSR